MQQLTAKGNANAAHDELSSNLTFESSLAMPVADTCFESFEAGMFKECTSASGDDQTDSDICNVGMSDSDMSQNGFLAGSAAVALLQRHRKGLQALCPAKPSQPCNFQHLHRAQRTARMRYQLKNHIASNAGSNVRNAMLPDRTTTNSRNSMEGIDRVPLCEDILTPFENILGLP